VKTDRKDVCGIAQLLRRGWYRSVHAKSVSAQDTRALLGWCELTQGKLLNVELSIRGILRSYLQHRLGIAVHQRRLHQYIGRGRHPHLDGGLLPAGQPCNLADLSSLLD